MSRARIVSCLTLLAASTSCASSSGSAKAPWYLHALTFNAALAPGFEPYSAERLPSVVAALSLAAQQLDVMCIQEFWVESDFDLLVDAASESLPYALHASPRPGSGVCESSELSSLGSCAQSHCSAAGDDSVACIQSECTTEVVSLSGGCLGCLLNHLDDFAQCARTGAPVADDPAIFGGNSDVGLLSRYPISRQQILPLDAYLQRGVVLYAQIEVPNLGPVHAFCTHLSSPLGVIPYVGPHGSWQGEHARETEQLLSFIAAEAESGPLLVMGDLNMGLALNGKGAVLPDDFARLQASGLRDPYLDSGNPECSECSDNSFRSPDSVDDLIDHLLVKAFPISTANVTQSSATPVAVANNGTTRDTHLSDHFGLQLELTSR